jgi:hypothetical protein
VRTNILVEVLTWIPFHFICDDETLICTRNNDVARGMVELAIADAKRHPDYALYRLGAALHSFADTWAHHGFSGIAHEMNSVWLSFDQASPGDAVTSHSLWDAGVEKSHYTWIGHTCLLSYPDYPWNDLHYWLRVYNDDGSSTDHKIHRGKNYESFMGAALECYRYLLAYRGASESNHAFSKDQHDALLKTLMFKTKTDENSYDEALNHFYDEMNKGVFGPELAKGPNGVENFVRYDEGKKYFHQIGYAKKKSGAGEEGEENNTDEITSEKAGASVGQALVQYWTFNIKWGEGFYDGDFYKFCEATKQQRDDVARLLRDRGIYCCGTYGGPHSGGA